MTHTRRDAITGAIFVLGKAGNGDISEEDEDRVDQIVTPARDLLSQMNVYDIGDVGEYGPDGGDIESAAFLPFCDFLAYQSAPRFDMHEDARLKALAAEAVTTLKRLGAPQRTLRTLRVDPGTRPYRGRHYP